MCYYLSRLVRQQSQDHKTTEVVNTHEDVCRALVTAWELEEVNAYSLKGSSGVGYSKTGAIFVALFFCAQKDTEQLAFQCQAS